ncbi:MAG: hypothetical protein NZ583_04725 [Desulfobacterota bacterium]|nr:hypothetical protein [Thermodesulfobacteriota bacterium]
MKLIFCWIAEIRNCMSAPPRKEGKKVCAIRNPVRADRKPEKDMIVLGSQAKKNTREYELHISIPFDRLSDFGRGTVMHFCRNGTETGSNISWMRNAEEEPVRTTKITQNGAEIKEESH